jgi:general secretion pathway protein I
MSAVPGRPKQARAAARSAEAAIRRAAGFTLLEVLIALVIIGVALAAAMRGAMTLTSSAEYTREKMLAVMTGENRLLELRLARERLDQGEVSLPCEQGGITFQCVQAVKPTPNPFFRRVEVRVYKASTDGSLRVLAELMTVMPTNQ